VALVYRVLAMDFNKLAGVVVNLLIKSHRYLVGVNLFHVPSLPALLAQHIEPVSPSPRREKLPIGEFLLILFACAHGICKALTNQYFGLAL
jgi:hypothetical protein